MDPKNLSVNTKKFIYSIYRNLKALCKHKIFKWIQKI